ncbi:MAG TPA: metallopeptidase family protein [Candidatus Omnitrophota bacterium]|nr:MAG: Possibl zinc metallo-peptidase [Candidatus Omnitrophica bacterium ADurb.Bin314]HPW64591.1 metallopeptidase family protein [Candidatus Omnitrophota bacterium]HQB94421.1 metallopeptidase family protein [Candidatus Omnitrophota bacterium]
MKRKEVPEKSRKEEMTSAEFEALVRETVKGLPAEFARRLENVAVVIRAEPSARQKKESGGEEELLGLYEGVPYGERTHHDGPVFPDRITIFRGPILRSCQDRREIRRAVRDTVLHEFAHYFGLSDEHMIAEDIY